MSRAPESFVRATVRPLTSSCAMISCRPGRMSPSLSVGAVEGGGTGEAVPLAMWIPRPVLSASLTAWLTRMVAP